MAEKMSDNQELSSTIICEVKFYKCRKNLLYRGIEHGTTKFVGCY